MPASKASRGLAHQAILEAPPAEPAVVWSPARPGWVLLDGVEYPCDDDEPMASSFLQAVALIDISSVLLQRYAGRKDVRVGVDGAVFYAEGRSDRYVAPDVYVALGVDSSDPQKPYFVWKEGKAPDFVLEVASRSTAKWDAGEKRDLYERMGVREYWLYDPEGGLHWPRLQLHELVAGRYERRAGEGSSAGPLSIASRVLGLDLRFERGGLRLWDRAAQEYLRTPAESEEQVRREAEARQAAEARLREEAEARREADARAADALRAKQRAEARLAEVEAALEGLQKKASPPEREG